jgi:hypothetical protein
MRTTRYSQRIPNSRGQFHRHLTHGRQPFQTDRSSRSSAIPMKVFGLFPEGPCKNAPENSMPFGGGLPAHGAIRMCSAWLILNKLVSRAAMNAAAVPKFERTRVGSW